MPVSSPRFRRAGAAAFAVALSSTALAQSAITVVEYYHAGLDHYFVTRTATEIADLDSGRQSGWARTGRTFGAWPDAAAGGAAASPVCRYYIPPDKGASHFFSASPAECDDVARRIGTDANFAGYVEETRAAFFAAMPDAATGACVAGTVPVYRLWNQRADANHRYATERSVRDEMIARGWMPEGYGPEGVAMCVPVAPLAGPVRVSADTPFASACSLVNGVLYPNAEVEPHVAINPRDPGNMVGVWQQDRWSNGGARGLVTGYSLDGGRTWQRTAVPFTRCAGGHAGNGGDFERASDPWVTFGPDGTAWQSSLSLTGGTLVAGSRNAITVSRSGDGGRTWSAPLALIVDGEQFFNDKEAITADPTDARHVYVAWDRLRRGGGGPTYFARTTDGGSTWEPAREIHDPGNNAQTLNNVPVVLADGTLILFFTRLDAQDGRNVPTLQLMRSFDKGATFSAPVTVAPVQSIGARDPETSQPVRDAAILGSVAAGPGGQLAVAWQDARFSGGVRDGIALSRSFDGGLTWTAPVQVNRDPGVQAFVPTVAIRADGTLGVTYFDFRSNTADPSTLPTEFWLAQSADGTNWTERRITGPFDLRAAPNANGLFIGDYMGLAARGNAFVSFYSATNADPNNRTDVHVAVVEPEGQGQAKSDATGAYRAAITGPGSVDDAFAAKIDNAVRAAMQRRIPGWRSPAAPLGTPGEP
ncbi:MAG TPA: sialidase family protein [Casimicrobiaceae bacterium]|nr:sialidase family protein [Casimicrobiaceae bacterium]